MSEQGHLTSLKNVLTSCTLRHKPKRSTGRSTRELSGVLTVAAEVHLTDRCSFTLSFVI